MSRFSPAPAKSALARLALAGLLIIGITLSLRAIAPGPRSAPDFDGSARGPEVTVSIATGATGSQIARDLFEAGVVKSELAFFRVAVGNPRSASIAPGEHRIETQISAAEALSQLLDPERIENLVRVRDGARLSEVIKELGNAGFTRAEISNALSNLKPPKIFKTKNLEGFLYPALYAPTREDSAGSLLAKMLARFSSSTADIDWQSGELKPLEILTVASLIEAEGTPDVFAQVSRVIYNRLAKGMALQLDATVHYALGKRGEIALSIADTKVESRYNTYRYRGLPPGPIGSPTSAAIAAALAPASGDWLYYVTVAPRQTRFTASYDEFLEFKAEYKRNLKAGKFE